MSNTEKNAHTKMSVKQEFILSEKDVYTTIEGVWIDNTSFPITVKIDITLSNYQQMIVDIVYMVLGGTTSRYIPAIRNFAIKYYILDNFTNINTDSLEDIYYWLNNYNSYFEEILSYINLSFDEVKEDVRISVDYQLSNHISSWNKIADLLLPILEPIFEIDAVAHTVSPEIWKQVIGAIGNLSNFQANDFKNVIVNALKKKVDE